MDAGEYETNVLLINNVQLVAYRIYEPVSSTSVYTFSAADVESRLINDGHMVYMDSARRGIWCFFLSNRDTPLPNQAEQLGLSGMMEVCGFPIRLVHEGFFEPVQLLKNRTSGPNPINTPTNSSSSGSALDLTSRNAQSSSLPPAAGPSPGYMVVDGNVVPSMLNDGNRWSSIPISERYQFFITAALSSLSVSFCHRIGSIPLDHRSLLLPAQAYQVDEVEPSEALQTSAIATFRIYLTTTGSFIISLCVTMLHGLIASTDAVRGNVLPRDSMILAAPLGAFGSPQGIIDGETNASWKNLCTKLFQVRGMPSCLLQNCSWLNISFLQKKPHEQKADGKRTPLSNTGPTAPWPASLCFRKPKIGTTLVKRLDKTSLNNMTEHLDPLNSAKAWHEGFGEMEGTISKRKQDREMALANENAESEAKIAQPNGYSSMTFRRSSNGGAGVQSGAMYPTPPDGIQQLGMPSSFDPSILSPGQPSQIAGALDADSAMQHGAVGDGFDGNWGGAETKREQVTDFLENDNMFGDDMFEANELTDADFSFFDEQPGGADMDLSVLPDMGAAMELSAALSQPPKQTPSHPMSALEQHRPSVVSPQFTKPELKHARSTLADESRQIANNMESFNLNSTVGLKRYPSPFDPDTVYKRVCASIPQQSRYPSKAASRRRSSVFEKVTFDPSLSLAAKKYQESGPFNYTIPSEKEKERKALESSSPVSTEPHFKAAKQRKTQPLANLNVILTKFAGGPDTSPTKPEDVASNSEESGWSSDDDDRSQASRLVSSPAKSSVANRRPDDDNISMAASFKDLENTLTDPPSYGSEDLVRLSKPEVPEVSMTKFFTDPEPAPFRLDCTDDDFMEVAQIVTEQAATGSLRFVPQNHTPANREERRSLVAAMRYTLHGLLKALPKTLDRATGCQLRPLIEVQDVPLPTHSNRIQPRPAGPEMVRQNNIFQLPPPHLEFRRYDTHISVLPPALSFWESLGLGASQGPKDIISLGVFPALDGMRDNVAAYLGRMGHVYENLKLGTFRPMETVTGIADGLLPFINDHEMTSMHPAGYSGSALGEYMMRLGQALAASSASQKNFVVHFIYSVENPATVVEYCAAFQELQEYYERYLADRKRGPSNALVMQLVPQDAVASETSVVILPPAEYSKLCIETYDRCTLFGGHMPAPAIVLEPTLPRVIEFKSITTPSPNVMQENSCVHVAYAQSADERWITAAWTDNRGVKQMTASYCLGRRNRPLSRQITEIIHEIWETTHDLISIARVRWRVIVAKCGPMDQQEIEYWTGLAQNETRATVTLSLLTVDTNPSLQLIPPAPKIPLTVSSVFYTTPVSTPQPNMVSPEQSGTGAGGGGVGATTPGGHDSSNNPNSAAPADSDDATLVDVTDTTWGVISSHRLNNSSSLTELNAALASGYLVKRTGPSVEDAPVAMEINLVHADPHQLHGIPPNMHVNAGPTRVYENLLREMLMCFRGLGSLARARGVVDRDTDVRPWHVAAAEKAVRALYLLM
ncbi:mediator of RNA polymerase II transcription subunit 13 [Rhypophila decipiens]|uniref:Mediator of RNA polymerase II transcription subunit 13 n=1 Tax=Rhypophila decipiens TaxID=261697 RepID=A0AAN6YIK7_9PEZI|nr:mediator of RNA polymerase II transcription subunit 13 [Rhypophila decipiens]